MKPTALITGISGQDGWFLARFLLNQGFRVVGTSREPKKPELSQPPVVVQGVEPQIVKSDLLDSRQINEMIREHQPDQVYHLAAYHHSTAARAQRGSQELDEFMAFEAANVDSTYYFLSAIKNIKPSCRFFYAGSAHMFGAPSQSPQNEDTPFRPNSPYSITKVAAAGLCEMFRSRHGIYACTGILYNHESSRRSRDYVSKKIVRTALAIARGDADSLTLGDPDALVDWGFAGDYVEAMFLMLQQNQPHDFLISSGTSRRVRDFVQAAFDVLGLDCEKYLKVDPSLIGKRPALSYSGAQVGPYIGDSSRLRQATGWYPRTEFKFWVRQMVEDERLNA